MIQNNVSADERRETQVNKIRPGGRIYQCRELQNDTADQEAEADRQCDTNGARDKERVVEDQFADTGGTGVIHLNRRDQGRVGRQDKQTGNQQKE